MAEAKHYDDRMPDRAIGRNGSDGLHVDNTLVSHAYAGRFPSDDRTQDGSDPAFEPRAPELVPDGGHPLVVSVVETVGGEGILSPYGAESMPNLAAMTGVTSSTGAGAWSTGSYVTLGDGSTCYWNGTAWIVGVAP